MSVQELNALHNRYIDLSGRFKAAWTFHQFLQGLRKLFVEETIGTYPADFQGVYSSLKEISQNLNASVTERTHSQLDRIENSIGELITPLDEQDNKVSPSLLRLFFQRVKNYDEKILTQMVRFYLYAQRGSVWPPDRVDKVDFLVSKLAHDAGPSDGGQDRARLREILASFWAIVESGPVAETTVEGYRRSLEELRAEVAEVETFDELHSRAYVRRYRELKHGLGKLFFEPAILLSVIDTNMAFRSVVRQLYQQEERSIFADYQRLSDLEKETSPDSELDRDLANFHEDVERFEQRVQADNVRLEEVAELRSRISSLLPRLGRQPDRAEAGGDAAAAAAGTEGYLETGELAGPGLAGPADTELLRSYAEELLEALRGSDRSATPKAVTLSRELFAFRLEPREVVAYRRLAQRTAYDPSRERFVLQSAALRCRMSAEAEEIDSLLDDSAMTREAPIFGQAQRTVRLADAYLRQFGHVVEQAVLDGDLEEARELQLLRMRLMRDYAGLWLLANRP